MLALVLTHMGWEAILFLCPFTWLPIQPTNIIPSNPIPTNIREPNRIPWSIIDRHIHIRRNVHDWQIKRPWERDIAKFQRIGIQPCERVDVKEAQVHATILVNGILGTQPCELVRVKNVNLVSFHVEATDAVPEEEGEIDEAVAFGTNYGWELERLWEREFFDLVGCAIEDEDLVGKELGNVDLVV